MPELKRVTAIATLPDFLGQESVRCCVAQDECNQTYRLILAEDLVTIIPFNYLAEFETYRIENLIWIESKSIVPTITKLAQSNHLNQRQFEQTLIMLCEIGLKQLKK